MARRPPRPRCPSINAVLTSMAKALNKKLAPCEITIMIPPEGWLAHPRHLLSEHAPVICVYVPNYEIYKTAEQIRTLETKIWEIIKEYQNTQRVYLDKLLRYLKEEYEHHCYISNLRRSSRNAGSPTDNEKFKLETHRREKEEARILYNRETFYRVGLMHSPAARNHFNEIINNKSLFDEWKSNFQPATISEILCYRAWIKEGHPDFKWIQAMIEFEPIHLEFAAAGSTRP